MGRVLVIGAGGVSTVAVKKMAMNADVFTDIMLASRTKSKCDAIARKLAETVSKPPKWMPTMCPNWSP